MKKRKYMFVCVLMTVALACSLPAGLVSPKIAETPTPDRTMTALFGTGIFGTLTALPNTVPSETPVPTGTELPTLTATSIETATPTITSTFLPSWTSTATLVPTVGITPVSLQRTGRVTASYMTIPPVLDGIWDEWTTTTYPCSNVIWGASYWTGTDDLDASFRLGWDYNYLYIAVKVKDDIYVQNSWGQDMYKGDGIEIEMDTDLIGDFYTNSLNYDDYQLGISPGNPGVGATPQAYLYVPSGAAGYRNNVIISTASSAGIYRVEMAIPWSVFGISAAYGKEFGFAVRVSDNDDTTQNVQQSMVAHLAGNHVLHPTTWGQIGLR